MKEVFACFGLFCTVAIIGCLIAALWYEFKEWIHRLKYNYRVKHRFDKPPTAKCYCRDCKRHDPKSGRCYKFKEWHTADCWFCWDAEPNRKEDEVI